MVYLNRLAMVNSGVDEKNALILIVVIVLTGAFIVAFSLGADLWLHPYDPYSLFDDFSSQNLDSNLWAFVGTSSASDELGTCVIEDSVVTLNAPSGGVSYLNHSFVTSWPSGVRYGSWKGSMEFSLRFNDLSSGGRSVKLARLDGGWVEVFDFQFTYYDEVSGRRYVLQPHVDNDWHLFNISYGGEGREVNWDRRLELAVSDVNRFTYVFLGHSDPDESSGGSVSFQWFKSHVDHEP